MRICFFLHLFSQSHVHQRLTAHEQAQAHSQNDSHPLEQRCADTAASASATTCANVPVHKQANIQVASAFKTFTSIFTHTYSSTLTWAFTHHHKHSSTTTTRRRRHNGVQNTTLHEPQVHILQKLIHFNPHRSISNGLGMARSGLAGVSHFVSCKCDPHFSVHSFLHDFQILV